MRLCLTLKFVFKITNTVKKVRRQYEITKKTEVWQLAEAVLGVIW